MQFGQEPLFFQNAYKDDDIKEGKERPIRNFHMNGSFIIVDTEIMEKLKGFKIKNFQLYPTVIIDDKDQFHEGFWAFNFFNKFTALDLSSSEIEDFDPTDKFHDVIKFCLSEEVLDAIPEENRLIFKENKSDVHPTIIHQKIVDIFNAIGVSTAKFVKLSDYEFGSEYGA